MREPPRHLEVCPGQIVTLWLPRGALLIVQEGTLDLALPWDALDGVSLQVRQRMAAGMAQRLDRSGPVQLTALLTAPVRVAIALRLA